MLPVLSNSAASEFHISFSEDIYYFSVAERFGRVFLLDDGANQFLDARVGYEVSVLTDVAVSKKVLERKDSVRGL